jgi:putative membrane protein insertion efficiency factor
LAAAAACAADPAPDGYGAVQASAIVADMAVRVGGEASAHDLGPIPPADADLYRLYISSQDGPHCTFRPTCSAYAKQAVRKRGWLRGILLAADRLLRCHGLGTAQYPIDPETGKYLDPVP